MTVTNVIASDSFGRTASSGWGTADTGGDWTVGTTKSNFAVANGAGTIKTAAGSGPTAYLNSVSGGDVDIVTSFGYDKAGTGSGSYTSVIARHNGTTDYRAKLQVTGTATTLYLTRVVSGSETVLATKAVSGLVYAPGDVLNIRFDVQGSGTANLQAKVWKSGSSEPSSWTVTTTDSTAALQSPGGVGFYSYLSSNATNSPVTLSVQKVVVTKLS